MTYEKDPFEFEEIPDYALQPAKEADEYNFHYIPKGATSRFDPAAYERVLHENARQAAEKEEHEMLDVREDKAPDSFEQAETNMFPEPCKGFMPDSIDVSQAPVVEVKEPEVPVMETAKPEDPIMETAKLEDPIMETAKPEDPIMETAKPEDPIMETAKPEDPIMETAKSEDPIMETAKPEDPIMETAKPEVPVMETAEPEVPVMETAEPEVPVMETAEIASSIAENEETEVKIVAFEEKEEDYAPMFAAPSEKRPVFQPVFVAKTAPTKVVPTVGNLVSSKLKLVDMKQKSPLRMTLEEDILVPDVKPDLARILAMDGNLRLAEREIHTGQVEADTVRIMGDLILQTLYVPEHVTDEEPMIAIESKIPFKNETDMKAGPSSDLAIVPNIESIDFTVINERKFRVKASVAFRVREYSHVDIEVFEGLRDDEVQMLKEKINLTDVAMRKTETMEIKDELSIKENSPEILKILKYDANVVENHKQITKEKAVINASVYCNILYLGTDGNTDTAEGKAVSASSERETVIPVLYQGKTEFTQFIRLDGEYASSDQNPAGSKVNFNISTLNLTAKEDGNGKKSLFELGMNVDTGLELYKNIAKEVVTDVYHHKKDIQYETDEIGVMALGGSGAAEISAREIINIPEKYGTVDKVVYISGNINEKKSLIDQTKSVVEGVVTVNLICTSADEKKTAFNITQEMPFRSAMEIPGTTSDMTANHDIALKELWFDKINNKQIEVNAGILVNTAVSTENKHHLVKNVSFLEGSQDNTPTPGIILYISRKGDTIWKIAKNYRTTIDEIKNNNELEFGKEIKPGTKLLIVAKNY